MAGHCFCKHKKNKIKEQGTVDTTEQHFEMLHYHKIPTKDIYMIDYVNHVG